MNVCFVKDVALGAIRWDDSGCMAVVLNLTQNTILPIRTIISHDEKLCMVELEFFIQGVLHYAWVGNSQYPINLITLVE
jgi:hypothetical protein